MAKKETAPKTVLERVYNVPLRREFQKVPRWRRTEKAVKALQEFISRHMKSENVLVGRYVNQYLWKDGIKNPPHHVKVNAVKDEKGTVKVELVELPGKAKREQEKLKELEKKTKKKEEQKAAEEKKPEEKKKEEAKEKEEKTEGKSDDKLEEAKKDKEEKAKILEKEGIKELKKELPKQQAPKQAPQPRQVEQRPTAPKSQ